MTGTVPTDAQIAALENRIKILKDKNDALNAVLSNQQKEEKKVEDSISDILVEYGICANPDLKVPQAVYDPIALTSHRVNFSITSNASFTPTWKSA